VSRFDFIQSKLVDSHQAARLAEMYRLNKQKIVFTNGCFDLLHLGHVTYLAKAAGLGNKLFVALNDDDSVRSLGKGSNRPVNPEIARLLVLASLGFVDHVLLFHESTPIVPILAIQPHMIVKGGDYDPEITDTNHPRYIVGKGEAESWGGQVTTIPLVEGYSTTLLLSKK